MLKPQGLTLGFLSVVECVPRAFCALRVRSFSVLLRSDRYKTTTLRAFVAVAISRSRHFQIPLILQSRRIYRLPVRATCNVRRSGLSGCANYGCCDCIFRSFPSDRHALGCERWCYPELSSLVRNELRLVVPFPLLDFGTPTRAPSSCGAQRTRVQCIRTPTLCGF